MKGWDSQLTIVLLIVSNLVAVLQLFAAIYWPRIGRISFALLFAWAAWTNWNTSHEHPEFYLDYAQLAWSGWYVQFIKGWFATHIPAIVGLIAICQALIAFSMVARGWIFKAGCSGAIVFLIAILPLGTGAGFPCTAIMAVAIYLLMRKGHAQFIWKPPVQDRKSSRNSIISHNSH